MTDQTSREDLEHQLEELDARAGRLYEISDQLDATEPNWAGRVREQAHEIARMTHAIRRLIGEIEQTARRRF